MSAVEITSGTVFDTPFESGLVALGSPDGDGNFDALDSDGVEVSCSLVMVTRVGPSYEVEYTVRGAYRISRRRFDSLGAAHEFAARWRRSNSTGHYVATISEVGPSTPEPTHQSRSAARKES